MHRSLPVNSFVLRQLRVSRGWSQKELARRAGYTDRLVRKAELGGRLDVTTIRDLAQALSVENEPVTFQSLVHDILSMAKRFVYGYDALGREMLSTVDLFLTDDFIFHVAGDPAIAPYAGDWHGRSGFQQFLDTFFGTVTRTPNSLTPTYSIGQDTAIARYVDTLQIAGQPPISLWVYLHFHFRDGFLYRVEDQYDTYTAAKTQLPPSEETETP